MSDDQRRAELREKGFVALPGALPPAAVARLSDALDRVYEEERSRGRVGDDGVMHLLGGVGRDEAFIELIDHARVFPLIWGELGWNIHLFHCHLDVTPPRAGPRKAPAWLWHQDGGRLNLDLDGDPRPRLSLKVVYWLSDVSEPGRANMLVIPGSHERNTLPRPERPELGFDPPDGAEPVLAAPGDALVFDRRLWHSRSENLSPHTRRAIFLAYTYRWIRPRDHLGFDPARVSIRRLSRVRRQLLGEPADPHSHWGLPGQRVPLKVELSGRGLLDPAIPSHR
ncbi:MAG TPA: phytanoyl-CoA dioxygenase family protein [Thermoleophilaceae bacterium]|jgi:hypothetical protein